MGLWDVAFAAAGVAASLATLVQVWVTARANPLRDAKELADALAASENAPAKERSIARAKAFEAAAFRLYSPPTMRFFGLGLFWVAVILLGTLLSPASPARKTVGFFFGIGIFALLILVVMKGEHMQLQKQTKILLLAKSRDELKLFAKEHSGVDTKTAEEKKIEEWTRRAGAWVQKTPGARETLLLGWLILLVVGLWLMARDLGWI